MNISDLIVIGIILVVLLGAALYIARSKKKGVHCIGCADAGKCSGNCSLK